MPDFFTIFRSCASRSRAPTMTMFPGSALGLNPPSITSSSAPYPMIAANGIPCTLPDGELSGVFMSPCASSHKYPICFFSLRKCPATPAATPAAMEWSPPSTNGRNPSVSDLSTLLAMSWQVSAISCRYFARFSPTGISSGCFTSRLPISSTVWPSFLIAACNPAPRSADGPISTPRRLWPRSMGTPMMRTFCGMCELRSATSDQGLGTSDQTNPPRPGRGRYKMHFVEAAGSAGTTYLPDLRIHPINHAREGDDLPNVLGPANPRHRALQPHPKPRMRHASIPPQIQVPLERLFR